MSRAAARRALVTACSGTPPPTCMWWRTCSAVMRFGANACSVARARCSKLLCRCAGGGGVGGLCPPAARSMCSALTARLVGGGRAEALCAEAVPARRGGLWAVGEGGTRFGSVGSGREYSASLSLSVEPRSMKDPGRGAVAERRGVAGSARNPQASQRTWKLGRHAATAGCTVLPGKSMYTWVCLPVSCLRSSQSGACVGSAWSGNFPTHDAAAPCLTPVGKHAGGCCCLCILLSV